MITVLFNDLDAFLRELAERPPDVGCIVRSTPRTLTGPAYRRIFLTATFLRQEGASLIIVRLDLFCGVDYGVQTETDRETYLKLGLAQSKLLQTVDEVCLKLAGGIYLSRPDEENEEGGA